MTVLTLEPLRAATEHVETWIKEHDYWLRQIVLPSNAETVWMRQNGAPHLIGEITFRTESGWFQVVPMQTATLEQIERLNDKCAR